MDFENDLFHVHESKTGQTGPASKPQPKKSKITPANFNTVQTSGANTGNIILCYLTTTSHITSYFTILSSNQMQYEYISMVWVIICILNYARTELYSV